MCAAGEGAAGPAGGADTVNQGAGGGSPGGQEDSDGGSRGPAPQGPGQDQSHNRKVSVEHDCDVARRWEEREQQKYYFSIISVCCFLQQAEKQITQPSGSACGR